MLIIAGGSHTSLAHALARELNVPITLANTQKFADQELCVRIDNNLYGQNVIIIQSTANPANDHLMELLLLADTAKKAGAAKVIAVMPYLGYSRQDQSVGTQMAIPAQLVARLIEAAGVDKVVTIDLHSQQAAGFFKIGVHNLDPSPLFLPLFGDIANCVVVSPDIGGVARARAFVNNLGVELAIINKTRKANGECVMKAVIGDVTNKNCILVDDIIATGSTLCKATLLLHAQGAQSVRACVTHAVLAGNALDAIKAVGLTKIYVTDTINHNKLPGITIASVAQLLAAELSALCLSIFC